MVAGPLRFRSRWAEFRLPVYHHHPTPPNVNDVHGSRQGTVFMFCVDLLFCAALCSVQFCSMRQTEDLSTSTVEH